MRLHAFPLLLAASLAMHATGLSQRRAPLFPGIAELGKAKLVRVDAAALQDLVANGEKPATRSLFGGADSIRTTSVERHATHAVIHGRLVRAAENRGTVTIVADRTGIVAAQIDSRTFTYTVRYTGRNGVHAVRVHVDAKVPECGQLHDPGHDGVVQGPGPTSAGSLLVDVLVPYTPLARKNAGGTAAMQNEVRLRIALANACNAGSGVNWRFRLVWTGETQYTEPNPVRLVVILSRLRGTNDGYMDEIHGIRDQFGGDVVALICDGLNRDWGGYAYCKSGRSSAFSITHREGLAAHLLTHEMGHNLGCAHNRANVDCSGSYSYSYGWRTKDNVYNTVMAYRAGNSKRVNHWSSPNVIVHNYVMGAKTEDNARSLNNRGPIVAKFSATTVLEWCTLSGGIAGALGVPALLGSGTINTAAPLRIKADRVAANAPGVLVAGLSTVNIPILGGTLVPSLDLVVPMLANATIDVSYLRLLPKSTSVWYQAFFLDAKAVQGWSATHAVKTIIP